MHFHEDTIQAKYEFHGPRISSLPRNGLIGSWIDSCRRNYGDDSYHIQYSASCICPCRILPRLYCLRGFYKKQKLLLNPTRQGIVDTGSALNNNRQRSHNISPEDSDRRTDTDKSTFTGMYDIKESVANP